ncbi:LMxysn_1693 family intestinal colonization protein [Radiobacillus deserti]|uniref:Uncharacterized protein n=1 Tax=Radiobacillus deserti TaxID=2594883 RepID=A0A516KJ27_9BACI|nr:hypothetical protein [Radiobacillus deserti]QDP41409.1 hypothetical protein FN924_15190 [Radiobacillus deserti]
MEQKLNIGGYKEMPNFKKVFFSLLSVCMVLGLSFTVGNPVSASKLTPPNNEENIIQPQCATCNHYEGYIKSQTLISKKYLGKVTKSSGYAINAKFTVYGVTFGGSRTYSESRVFREYSVKRKYVMHFDVYNGAGYKIDSFDTTRYITTKEYERSI